MIDMEKLDLKELEAQFGLMVREKNDHSNYALFKFSDLEKISDYFDTFKSKIESYFEQTCEKKINQQNFENDLKIHERDLKLIKSKSKSIKNRSKQKEALRHIQVLESTIKKGYQKLAKLKEIEN